MARPPARAMQISLRGLLLIALVVGVLAGTCGPKLAAVVRDWRRPAPQPEDDLWSPPHPDAADTGYFESAESPLR